MSWMWSRTRRRAPFALSLAAVLLLPALALAAGETKTFQEQNFKLTTPSADWQWIEPTADMKSAGYVVSLGRQAEGTVALVYLRVQNQSNPPLDISELTDETAQGLQQAFFATVAGTRKDKGKLSGIDGTLIFIKGVGKDNKPVFVKVYTILAENRFHQMIFRLIGGAETKQAAEIEALRRGFRLLKGAGPEEPQAPDLGPSGGGLPDDDGGGSFASEEKTLEFTPNNVKWTLPDGSPFHWTEKADDPALKQGILAQARAAVPIADSGEKPPPGAPEPPKNNVGVVALIVGPAQAGAMPGDYVKDTGIQSHLEQAYFDRLDYGRTQTKDDVPIGNAKGAALQMVGAKKGRVVYVREYFVLLQGRLYQIETLLTGDRTVDDVLQKPLNAVVKGLEFLDTTEWVLGPLAIPGVPAAGRSRGWGLGEEKKDTALGCTTVKPPEMAGINFDVNDSGGNMRVAWEARSDDKQAYLYFDLQTWPKSKLLQANTKPEDLVAQRADQWTQNVESPETIARGREPFFPSRYGRGRGVGYEFTGEDTRGTPFVERGYVVTYKDYVYWVRIQLGGKDAEKKFSKILRQLQKCVKMG